MSFPAQCARIADELREPQQPGVGLDGQRPTAGRLSCGPAANHAAAVTGSRQ
jgi:hypothetical protein